MDAATTDNVYNTYNRRRGRFQEGIRTDAMADSDGNTDGRRYGASHSQSNTWWCHSCGEERDIVLSGVTSLARPETGGSATCIACGSAFVEQIELSLDSSDGGAAPPSMTNPVGLSDMHQTDNVFVEFRVQEIAANEAVGIPDTSREAPPARHSLMREIPTSLQSSSHPLSFRTESVSAHVPQPTVPSPASHSVPPQRNNHIVSDPDAVPGSGVAEVSITFEPLAAGEPVLNLFQDMYAMDNMGILHGNGMIGGNGNVIINGRTHQMGDRNTGLSSRFSSIEELIQHLSFIENSNRNSNRPAAKAIVDSLPKQTISSLNPGEDGNVAKCDCCICMCDMEEGEVVTEMPCGHLFHGGCIQQWLATHNTCPVCREKLATDADIDNNDDPSFH